ncbi:MAG: hypothetical protein GOU98_01025 [Candidatus Altiarchaeota archaeon]|nr:hypothetical protein [Candidatus Altiarchaeota archaeon]
MKKEIEMRDLILGGLIVLSVVAIFNSITTMSVTALANEKILEISEAGRPAELEATIITVNCEGCFDILSTYNDFKENNVKILIENFVSSDSSEAQKLIITHKIENLPTIILRGETDKFEFSGFEKTDGTLVYTEIKPPYIDADTSNVVGQVRAIILKDKDCSICADLNPLIQSLTSTGISITSKELERTSSEAVKLIEENKIERVPTILFTKDISLYDQWESIQAPSTDNYFVIDPQGPYVNTTTGEIKGQVNLIMLVDEECSDCYDVTLHKQILPNFGIILSSEKTLAFRSEEGMTLVEKYSITKIPTIVLQGDFEPYPALDSVWSNVGTVEDDKTHIFREISAMGDVKFTDLEAS